jgi:ATP-binding cassette subfamily B protein
MIRLKGAWHMWRYLPRLFPYLRPYKKLAAFSVVLTAIAVVLSLAAPWPLAFMVDSVLGKHRPPALITNLLGTNKHHLLVFAALAGLTLALLTNGITVVHEWVNTKIQQRLVLDFRSAIFAHAQRLSVGYHDLKPTGQMMNQILAEAEGCGTLMVSLLPLVQSAVMLVGMFVIAFTIDRELALISLVVVPFIYYSAVSYHI